MIFIASAETVSIFSSLCKLEISPISFNNVSEPMSGCKIISKVLISLSESINISLLFLKPESTFSVSLYSSIIISSPKLISFEKNIKLVIKIPYLQSYILNNN